MRPFYTVLFSMFAGIGIGAGAIHAVQAQNKPPVYGISEIDVTNAEGYTKEFVPLSTPIIKAHGGRVLAAGQATGLAGDPPKARMVIIAWDSVEQAQGWFLSPEYKKARAVGEKYATFRTYIVPGVTPQ